MEFRKSGFSDEDSAKLASIAEKYRNIADEEISAGESASFIIAQMKAFNIEAGQAEHIIDSVNEVANRFSVSSADLATNLGNMSEIMAINNVSMEQQIGMLTGVTEITRNASSASRGLVMISSRLTQVLDDSSSTGKKLTKIYNDLDIALKDENGQLRSHYDILGDLATKWDSLSENQQKYIALTSAGARQQQNFVALMENWSQVARATTSAYESMGSAQRENEKVMDSIEKKVEILRSQFQQLVIGEGGLQDFAKSILNIGIVLLKFANSDVGEVVLQTTVLITTVTLLTSKFIPLSAKILDAGKDLMVYALALQGATMEEIAMTVASMGLADALKAIAAAMLDTTIAFLTSPIGVVVVGLTACTVAALASTKAFEKYQKRLQDANEELNTLKDSAEDTKSELDGLKDALKSTQDRLKEIEELKITNSEDLDILEKETKELEEQEKSLERKIALKERELELSQQEAESQARKTLETTTESQIKQTELVDSFSGAGTGQYVGITVTPTKELELAKTKYGELKVAVENLQAQLDKTDPKSEKYQELSKELSVTETSMENTKNRGIEMSEIILNSADALTSADDATVQYKDSLYELVDGFDELVGITRESNEESEKTVEDVEAEEEAAKELEDSIKELAETLGITATELAGLSGIFDDLTLESFLSQLAEARQQISDTSTVIDNLQDALETASSALEEYNENGYLTVDTFQSLMSISAQYLTALVNENGQLEINQTTMGNLIEKLKEAKIQELQTAETADILAYAQGNVSEMSSLAQAALQNAGIAAQNAGQQAASGASGFWELSVAIEAANNAAQGKTTIVKNRGIEAIHNSYKKLSSEISNIKVNTTKAGNAAKSAGSAAKSAGRAGTSAAKSATNATKELNKELEETKSKYDKVISWIKKQYDKKTDSLEKAKDAATDAIEKEIKALEKEKDTILDGIEKETDALEKEKDAREKYWDDQIDALKKANQERKDALELQEKLDALAKARNTKVKIYKEGKGFVFDVDQTAVAEAQKALDEYLSEKAYEDELARLEALKDAEMDNYDKRIDALNDYKDKVSASYEEQIAKLEDHKAELEAQYDAEIEMYNNYKQQFEDMVNAYQEEQDRLLAQQLLGINLESDNWMTRLDNLAEFVRKYNELQKQLDTGNTSVSNNASMKSGGSGSSSGGSSSSSKRTVTNRNTPTKQYAPDYSPKQREYTARVKHIGRTYASGTSSVKEDEIAVVGENPNQEIVIGSKLNNGELMSLDKGTGVVNAGSSSTLAGMLNQVGKFGASGFGSGNGTLNNNINNDTLTINGVTIQGADINDPQTFVNGLLNLKSEALQRAYKYR